MNPQKQFCHNQHCWAYGRKDEEHIVIHSQKEKRYRCKRCHRTFTQTKGTALYRLHKPQELVFVVLTLLAYGSPIQAIVAAFGLDERTVTRWQKEAGSQCRRVHRAPGGSWEGRAFSGAGLLSCACGWWAGLCGWLRRWRSEAACGLAVS